MITRMFFATLARSHVIAVYEQGLHWITAAARPILGRHVAELRHDGKSERAAPLNHL